MKPWKHATCPLLWTIPEWALHIEDLLGNSIMAREKASGLSWLEIDQVIQIPPWREAKRIGFKTGWEKTTRRRSSPVDFILTIRAGKNKLYSRLSAALTQASAQERLTSDPAAIRSSASHGRLQICIQPKVGYCLRQRVWQGYLGTLIMDTSMKYKTGCWLHSVWSPLASRVQVDARAHRVHSQTGGDAPLLTTHRPSSRSPDLVRLKAGNPALIKVR